MIYRQKKFDADLHTYTHTYTHTYGHKCLYSRAPVLLDATKNGEKVLWVIESEAKYRREWMCRRESLCETT